MSYFLMHKRGNPWHDPKNGQFTSGPGGSSGRYPSGKLASKADYDGDSVLSRAASAYAKKKSGDGLLATIRKRRWAQIEKIREGNDRAYKAEQDRKAELKRVERLMKTPNRKLTAAELSEKKRRIEQERSVGNTPSNYFNAANDFLESHPILNYTVKQIAVPALTNVGKNYVQTVATEKINDYRKKHKETQINQPNNNGQKK